MYAVGFKSIIPHAWYLSLIVTMYLSFPLFLSRIRNKGLVSLLLTVYALVAIEYATVNLFPIAVFRIPTFITGIWIGYICSGHSGRGDSIKWVNMASYLFVALLIVVLSLAAFLAPAHRLWNPGQYWTLLALFSPVLSIALLVTCRWVTRLPGGILSKVGACSYEIYLSHQLIYDLLHPKMVILSTAAWWRWLVPFIILMVVFVFSFLFHLCLTKAVRFSFEPAGLSLTRK
jgi:peptidoglycan/LPS O-acetylase OafA/YrhL